MILFHCTEAEIWLGLAKNRALVCGSNIRDFRLTIGKMQHSRDEDSAS